MSALIKHAFAITPSEQDLKAETREIYVGNGGRLDVVVAGGESVSLAGVQTGTVLRLAVLRVLPTTTASGLVGLY